MSNKLRTNPFLSLVPYLIDDTHKLLLVDIYHNEYWNISNPEIYRLLIEATDNIDRSSLAIRTAELLDYSIEQAETLVGNFEDANLLWAASESTNPEQAADRWRSRDWEIAFRYYLLTHDYPFIDDVSRAGEKQLEMANTEGLPPRYKRYPSEESIALPHPFSIKRSPSLATVLHDSPQARIESDNTPLSPEALSFLLYLSLGQTGIGNYDSPLYYLQKPNPAGGGLHPTEGYLVPADVDGIERGVYHYSVEMHALEKIPETDPDAVLDAVLGPASESPSLVMLLTSVVERNMAKYHDPIVFRILQHDIGHVLQTLALASAGLDRRFDFGRVDSLRCLSDHLDLDPLQEPLFGYAIVD